MLKIKSINQLYEEYKILFIRQLRNNSFTKAIFEVLEKSYSLRSSPSESYFSSIKELNSKYDIIIDINMDHRLMKENLAIIENSYKVDDDILISKLKTLVHATGTAQYDHQARMELKLLLTVNFT